MAPSFPFHRLQSVKPERDFFACHLVSEIAAPAKSFNAPEEPIIALMSSHSMSACAIETVVIANPYVTRRHAECSKAIRLARNKPVLLNDNGGPTIEETPFASFSVKVALSIVSLPYKH